jgi:hypothetical protein
MPRPRDPANEVRRSAQERWRARTRAAGRPEVDLVDTAVSTAVTVFGHAARRQGTGRDIAKADALERMAINFLTARGCDRVEATRMVIRRLRREKIDDLVSFVNDQFEAARPPVTS